MKAAVFHGEHDVRVEEVTDPRPPGPGEVLLRPLWCGICGTDLHEYAMGPIVIPAKPHRLNGAQLPQVLGHEFSAEVLAVGPDVGTVSPGQRVSVMPLLFCGACYYCRRGLNHLCSSMACIGLSYDWGGIAERAVVPATHVTPLPDGVSDLQGALVEPAAVAAYGVDVAQVRPGDTVLVTGAGPIGALASLYAASLGARVIVSEVNPVRAATARALDVGDVLDPTEVDVVAWLREHTEGVGADAVIECSGNERALQTAIEAVRPAGRISQTGLHTRAASIEPMRLSEHDITLAGTWCYPVTDWPRIIDLVARGRLPVERVVTAQVPMDDVVERGFEVLLSPTGDQVKVLVQAAR
jgi:(R,R)-butanediol dehydrogenase/meso-butanediol dehydrogenase/diacetyl reductase